jgi:hypothetical protein
VIVEFLESPVRDLGCGPGDPRLTAVILTKEERDRLESPTVRERGAQDRRYELPIAMPAMNTKTPPTTT